MQLLMATAETGRTKTDLVCSYNKLKQFKMIEKNNLILIVTRLKDFGTLKPFLIIFAIHRAKTSIVASKCSKRQHRVSNTHSVISTERSDWRNLSNNITF